MLYIFDLMNHYRTNVIHFNLATRNYFVSVLSWFLNINVVPADIVMLEFNQYTPGSRWRTTTIDRKDHREEGNEADGFYGGIRKLQSNEEISMWRHLWPTDALE